MSTFDKVGDLIIRLKNGSRALVQEVKVMNSKYNKEILNCLLLLGYIIGYKEEDKKIIKVNLKYQYNKGVFNDCERISCISKRVYWSYKTLKAYKEKNIVVVYTSSSGVISNNSIEFELKKQGGEPLFIIK